MPRSPTASPCLLSLGANLGDREANLKLAVQRIEAIPYTKLVQCSDWRETEPIGGPTGQSSFLNGAVLCETRLPPHDFLAHLTAIEAAADRKRPRRWAARTLDIDLILYDRVESDSAVLRLPHPRLVARPFVLEPAAQVAPWMVHPEAGWTIERLANNLRNGAPYVAIAAHSAEAAQSLGRRLADRSKGELAEGTPRRAVTPDSPDWPRLVIAMDPSASCAVSEAWGNRVSDRSDAHFPSGLPGSERRRILSLPSTGGVLWIGYPATTALDDARAAIAALSVEAERDSDPRPATRLTHWEYWPRSGDSED